MEFKENVEEFLKVIDFDLCVVDEKGITIHDKHNEESLNYVLEFPIDFKSNDNMRIFRCNQSDKYYTINVMNAIYPKQPFIKNGIEMFKLGWRNGVFSSKEDDVFSAEIFHDGSLYNSFIGRILGKNQVSYQKLNHEESINVLYRIDSEKKFIIVFNADKKAERRISIQVPIENKSQKAVLCVEEEKQEVYRQELETEEVEDYMHSLFYKAGNIIMETHEGIKTLDSTIFDKVFDCYDIAKEYRNIMNHSKASNDVINELFKKYFDSDEFKIEETWIETMNKVAARLTPIQRRKFLEEHEQSIQEQMQELKRQEYESEVAQMQLEEEENFDSEDWNMILGNNTNEHLSQMIREDFEEEGPKEGSESKGPTKVLKRTEEQSMQHMREMIRKDFSQD